MATQGFVKDLVDRYIYQDRQTEDYGRTTKWMQDDPNSAYNELYRWATDHYARIDRQNARDQITMLQAAQQGSLDQLSGFLGTQLNNLGQNFNNSLSSAQSQADITSAYYSNLLSNQAISNQAQLAATQQPRTAQFNPNYYAADWNNLNTQQGAAESMYNQGLAKLKQFDPSFNDTIGTGLLSQSQQGRQGVSAAEGRKPTHLQSGTIPEFQYAPAMQTVTDFNNQVQSQYQGLLGTLSNLSSYGMELYNRGVAKESELKQSRLNERSQYFAQRPAMDLAKAQSRAEERGSGLLNQTRGRTFGFSRGSGLLSNLSR